MLKKRWQKQEGMPMNDLCKTHRENHTKTAVELWIFVLDRAEWSRSVVGLYDPHLFYCMITLCFVFYHFISASSIGRYVKKKLSEVDIWFGPYIKIHEALRSAITVCETWISACESLTLHLWKRYSPHPWKGNKFVPKHLQQLAQRIEEVNQ